MSRFSEFVDFMKLMPGTALAGIHLWVDPPRVTKLTLDPERAHRGLGLQEPLTPYTGPVHQLPPMKWIYCTFPYRESDGQLAQESCRIAIDLEKRRIDYDWSDSWMFGQEHQGSAAIGVALISFPIMLPLSPFLLGARKYYELQEKRYGMSRHGIAILKALKGQLDSETEALLTEALKNSWTREQKFFRLRPGTLEEAKALLSQCDLHEDDVDDGEFGISKNFNWFDDAGVQVAEGWFHPGGARDIDVLGTQFNNEQAEELIKCSRSHTVRIVNDDTDE